MRSAVCWSWSGFVTVCAALRAPRRALFSSASLSAFGVRFCRSPCLAQIVLEARGAAALAGTVCSTLADRSPLHATERSSASAVLLCESGCSLSRITVSLASELGGPSLAFPSSELRGEIAAQPERGSPSAG